MPGERLRGGVRSASLACLGPPYRLVERISASCIQTAGQAYGVRGTPPASEMRSRSPFQNHGVPKRALGPHGRATATETLFS